MNPRGSVDAYAYLLARETNRSQIVLYSGNWDVVVPYTDTVKNIKSTLKLRESYIFHPWFTGNQHAGFAQLYSGLLFLTVKGASHQVPQSKREAAFQIFQDTLSGHPEFQHLPENIKSQFVKDEWWHLITSISMFILCILTSLPKSYQFFFETLSTIFFFNSFIESFDWGDSLYNKW